MNLNLSSHFRISLAGVCFLIFSICTIGQTNARSSADEITENRTPLSTRPEPIMPPIGYSANFSIKARSQTRIDVAPAFNDRPVKRFDPKKKHTGPSPEIDDETADDDDTSVDTTPRFHWKAAFAQSGLFLAIQHGIRMTQPKTRDLLGGPFFRNWGKSFTNLHGWGDGDNFVTNYMAHPMQGSVTGRIFINNSDRSKKLEFGNNKEYWQSRLKAMAWSAAWSTQFELGPVSEATIGHVGLRTVKGHSTMAYVDLVVTPTIGTGVLTLEDIADKYLLKRWIEKSHGPTSFETKLFRCLFTPTAAFANILRFKMPWKRNDR